MNLENPKFLSIMDDISAAILFYHLNISSDNFKKHFFTFFQQFPLTEDSVKKLIEKIKEKAAGRNNINIPRIILLIKVELFTKQILKLDSKGKHSTMKQKIDEFFKNDCPAELMQEFINYFINYKTQKSNISFNLHKQILNPTVSNTANEIKQYCNQNLFVAASNCIQESCEVNYKAIKIFVPLLILKCFDLIEQDKNDVLSFVIREILRRSEIILNNENFANSILNVQIPKSLWIDTFSKVTHSSITNRHSAINLLLFNGVSKISEKISQKLIINLNETDNCFAVLSEFLSNCSPEFLRVGVMELISKIHHSLIIKRNDDLKVSVENILNVFYAFVTKEDDKFQKQIYNGKVPPYLWEKTLSIIFEQDPSECFAAIDLLLHISEPDSDKRKEFISRIIDDIKDHKKFEWEKYRNRSVVESASQKNVQNVNLVSESVVLPALPKKHVRSDTMIRISELTATKNDSNMLLKILTNYKTDKNDVTSNDTGELKKHTTLLKLFRQPFKKDKEFDGDKKIIYGQVTDEIWATALDKCWEILPLQKMSSWKTYSNSLDCLFHISIPESKKRSKFIKKRIRSALNEPTTFHIGVASIKTFNLKKLEKKERKTIVENSKKFEKRDVISTFFPEDLQIREKFLKSKTNFWHSLLRPFSKKDNLQRHPFFDEETQKQLDDFFQKSFKESELYEHQFKVLYTKMPELCVADDDNLTKTLLNIITCYEKDANWSKYFNLLKLPCPECLRICDCKCYHPDATKFIDKLLSLKRINVEEINFPQSDIKLISYWGKMYKCIYIDKPETLFIFLIKHLVHNRGYIAIDCETNKLSQVSLLQLAAYGHAWIIDIQRLQIHMSPLLWKIFFEHLSKSTLIGFSYGNDRKYLSKTFPFLREFFQKQKVLCLQKFAAKIIIENPNEISKFFPFSDKYLPGAGLAALAKAVFNIDLDKSEQKSNWGQRPLTDKQINYAFCDALIPYLIHDEMRNRGAAVSVEVDCFITMS